MQKGTISKYPKAKKIPLKNRTWPDNEHTCAPIWASVDLRDGNQALAIPMNIEEKLKFFDCLVATGFKEIEVGFPSASDTEYNFIRRLIEEKRIPEDVTIQVLVQAREHLIKKTFESLEGAHSAIIHLYNSTSPLQRKVTFNKSKEEIKAIAVEGTRLVKSLSEQCDIEHIRFEYSPESFSDTEVEYALEVCQAVMDVWKPTKENPIILNLPATVEISTPNVYADQIEWFCTHLENRESAIISLHTHNDRGTGIAATELGLLAGADRVEGTLFGNGERTGNLDIVTVALNLYSQGIDPKLDLSDLASLRKLYEEVTRMQVPERHPYSGDLVFTAFSGSHQDAIKKGMDLRNKQPQDHTLWEVPYLLIDPNDIGRNYEAIIRINSQSGKGGVAYLLNHDYGLDLPKAMHPEVGDAINSVADKASRELSTEEIYHQFKESFVNLEAPLKLLSIDRTFNDADDSLILKAEIEKAGEQYSIQGTGNGPISAFVNALDENGWKDFTLNDYRQHSIGSGSKTEAAAYVQIIGSQGTQVYGCGIDPNIEKAGLKALLSAYNRLHTD
ncbi:MAG: 2-isopropylmalate synthase [Verrucomicrobia bacterium]|nr:2-isopropylmalate synthase [Verrucomicrobiota bacterium]